MLLTREHQNICSAANRWRSRHHLNMFMGILRTHLAFGLVLLCGGGVNVARMHTMHLWDKIVLKKFSLN